MKPKPAIWCPRCGCGTPYLVVKDNGLVWCTGCWLLTKPVTEPRVAQ